MVEKPTVNKSISSAPAHQSDEIFRQLVDSVQDYAIFLLDPHGIVMAWNDGAERIKGYKSSDIIGQHFSRFYSQDARESGWPDRELEIAGKQGRFTDEGKSAAALPVIFMTTLVKSLWH